MVRRVVGSANNMPLVPFTFVVSRDDTVSTLTRLAVPVGIDVFASMMFQRTS
jgi:hypothetical protein